MGLFSWLTLVAHRLHPDGLLPVRSAAWYHKSHATFSDVIALVRAQLWPVVHLSMSSPTPNMKKLPPAFNDHLVNMLCYAN